MERDKHMIKNTQPKEMSLQLDVGFTAVALTHNIPEDRDVAAVAVWQGIPGDAQTYSVSEYQTGFNTRIVNGLQHDTTYDIDIGFLDEFVPQTPEFLEAKGAGLVTLASTLATTLSPATIAEIIMPPIAVGNSIPVSIRLQDGEPEFDVVLQVATIAEPNKWTTVFAGPYEEYIVGVMVADVYTFRLVSTVSMAGASNRSIPQYWDEDVVVEKGELEDIDVDVSDLEDAVAALDLEVESLLEDVIWNTTKHTEKVTDIGVNRVAILANEEAVVAERTARVSQGDRIEALVEDADNRITSEIERVDLISLDLDGVSTAVSTIQGRLDSEATGLSALYGLTQAAQLTADDAATVSNTLYNQVNNSTTGLSASNTIAQNAYSTANSAYTRAGYARQEAADAVQASTLVSSRVSDVEGLVNNGSDLYLAVTETASQFFLSADSNGRIVGVKGSATANTTNLNFYGQNVRFLKADNSAAIYFNTATGNYVFDGHITARSGTFTGAITGSTGVFVANSSSAWIGVSGSTSNYQANAAGVRGTYTGASTAGAGVAGYSTTGKGGEFNGKGIGVEAYGVTGVDAGGTSYGVDASANIAVRGIGNTYGGQFTASGGTAGVSAYGAAYGVQASSANVGVEGTGSVYGVIGVGGTYDFYSNGNSYGSFTGAHDALYRKDSAIPEVGDILVDMPLVIIGTKSSTITEVAISQSPKQKTATGVFTSIDALDFTSGRAPAALSGFDDVESLGIIYDRLVMNAVGEGVINVCGEAGDIEPGDLIVTSSIPGKGMLQGDDILRSCTVAEARQKVTFESPTQIKQIACIYRCG